MTNKAIPTPEGILRTIEWNAARYERRHDIGLTTSLLAEELDELYTADNAVEFLDAIGDVIFVAIGALWKLGVSADNILWCFTKLHDSKTTKELLNSASHIVSILVPKSNLNLKDALALRNILLAIEITYNAMYQTGLTDLFADTLLAVCKSNETKSVPSVVASANVKVNVDKGSNFVPPTDDLIALLKGYKHD